VLPVTLERHYDTRIMDSSKGGGLAVQNPDVDVSTLTPLSPEVISRQVRGYCIEFDTC
jgi:hypothetical protein